MKRTITKIMLILSAVLMMASMPVYGGETGKVMKEVITERGASSKRTISVAVGKTRRIELYSIRKNPEVKKISWKSSDKRVAVVNSEGTVKGKSKGTANVTAIVTYRNKKVNKYNIRVRVSAPKLSRESINMTTGSAPKKINVWGKYSCSTVKFSSTRSRVASVNSEGIVTPHSKGIAAIRVTVDGREMKCIVVVSEPYLESYNVMLAPNKSEKIKLKGITKKSKVKYVSKNANAAKVSSSGKVTSLNYGRSDIIVTVDGKQLRFLVEVAPQRAIDAAKRAVAIKSVSAYSQENRMSEGYYDCSSLVFKAYGYDSELLGGTPTWAPTAANMAKHMADTGKVIAYENINLKDLRPGDLIFQGGEDNGRYMGIYHVEMYCGGENYWFFNIVMVARPIPA